MLQLKKKMAEQSKIVKMKESTDKQMGKLGGEILVMFFKYFFASSRPERLLL